MSRLPVLPAWVLPPTLPSVYESESATALEMVAKVYGATKAVVEDYNKFVDEINKEISDFTSSSAAEIAEFKKTIEKRLDCQFKAMNTKMAEIGVELQKSAINHFNSYVEEGLKEKAEDVILEMIAAGTIKVNVVYDPNNEEITLVTGGAE